MGRHELDFCGSGYGQVGGSCEYEYEHPGCIKYGELLDCLRNCQLIIKNTAQ